MAETPRKNPFRTRQSTPRVRKPAKKKSVAEDTAVPGPGSEERPTSLLRGLLATPPEVTALVEQQLKDHPVTDREKQHLTDCFNLQYYFGGQHVLYRTTKPGKEVLGVGLDEIRGVLGQNWTPAQRESLVIRYAEKWPPGNASPSK